MQFAESKLDVIGEPRDDVSTESGSPTSPAIVELLDRITLDYPAIVELLDRPHRLCLPWSREKQKVVRGHLDKCFLVGHECPSPMSLTFLPDLHCEVENSWKKPY